MNTHDIELPPLPEWIQEQMPCDTKYPVSTMVTAMKQYAKIAIEADRKRRQSEAEEVCAEAYQVVGSLLFDLGIFETEHAEKILDNLSQARMVHKDVLPWHSHDRMRRGEPVAWRYLTPTGWHATTDAAQALGVAEHHTIEPLYAAPQSDDFSAQLSRIEDSMKVGARLTPVRDKLRRSGRRRIARTA